MDPSKSTVIATGSSGMIGSPLSTMLGDTDRRWVSIGPALPIRRSGSSASLDSVAIDKSEGLVEHVGSMSRFE